MSTPQNDDPAVVNSIAVYDEKQKRILSGELVGIVGGALFFLALSVVLWGWTTTNLFSQPKVPVRAEFAYNYEGVQRVDYSAYLSSIKRERVQPSAEAITAYNAWAQANPQTKNVQVLNKYLGDQYNNTADVFGYMSAYVVPGVGVSCEYCHNLQDFSDDSNPKKAIAKNMLVMQFETQNKWIGTLPKPEGQPAHVLTCATCHVGRPNSWNNGMRDTRPQELGVAGGGLPYGWNLADQQFIDTRADADGNVNYFQATLKAVTNNDKEGLAAVERNQNTMYHVNTALQVGCDFCHYGGYFPAYVLENGTFKWPKAQARHMMGLVQDLAVNWWPQLGTVNTAQPNCYLCHRGNVVPPGADLNAPRPSVVSDPLIKPIVDLPIPKSVVPPGTK